MLETIYLVFMILFLFGITIFVHEWGHFWVARRFGVKVLKFSIGFGKPLLHWYDKLGTEYRISAIPLGGYVSFLSGMKLFQWVLNKSSPYCEKASDNLGCNPRGKSPSTS